jgi:hypothetical protein
MRKCGKHNQTVRTCLNMRETTIRKDRVFPKDSHLSELVFSRTSNFFLFPVTNVMRRGALIFTAREILPIIGEKSGCSELFRRKSEGEQQNHNPSSKITSPRDRRVGLPLSHTLHPLLVPVPWGSRTARVHQTRDVPSVRRTYSTELMIPPSLIMCRISCGARG